jgi:hypothetical protein
MYILYLRDLDVLDDVDSSDVFSFMISTTESFFLEAVLCLSYYSEDNMNLRGPRLKQYTQL